MRRARIVVLAGLFAAGIVALAGPAWGIETTYGEDPVPNSQCYDGFLDLGYGIDPIPAKTLTQRWHEWRAARGLPGPPDIFHRQVGGGTTRPMAPTPQAAQPRPSSRRAYQTQSATRQR
jgi:hypothetical protein